MSFLNMMSLAFIYPVMPGYATFLGATIAQVGLAVALLPSVAAVAQPFAGIFSDRIGRRISLIVGATPISSASCSIYSLLAWVRS